MKGFFSLQETQSTSRPDGKVYSCISCGLYKNTSTPKMKSFGNFKKDILIIGDNPSLIDDEQGKPLQDKNGRFLKKELKKCGVDLFEDCLITFATKCHGKYGSYHIACCRKFLLKILEEYQPKLIITLGQAPIESLLGHRWKKDLGGIHKWRGWQIPDQDFKSWLCPIFDPGFVNKADTEVETVWRQDIRAAIACLDKPFLKWKKPDIRHINDLSLLSEIKSDLIAIDYETTGIKPHAAGHRIACASVAVDENTAYTFLMPKTKKERLPFLCLLRNPAIGKMAHNMKFEENWSITKLRQPVINWEWDSMLAAHILDNRPNVTSLKFQAYVQFGLVDYDSEINPYLKSTENKDSNSFNRVLETFENPRLVKILLEYCAMDTIIQYRLAMKQIAQMNYSFLPF